MPARFLLQLFVLIALALAPVCGMGGTGMATPAGTSVAAHHSGGADQGHCAVGGEQPGDGSDSAADAECRMMCPGVLAPAVCIGETCAGASAPQTVTILLAAPGFNAAAEPPPPRLS